MKKRLAAHLSLLLLISILLCSCRGNSTSPDLRISIPRLQDFRPDGNLNEWSAISPTRLYANPLGEYPSPDNLEAWLRTAWNDEGIVIALDITDDQLAVDTVSPWNADAVEIFMAPSRGSDDILQMSFVPVMTAQGKPVVRINDFRETPALQTIDPDVSSSFVRKGNHTTWEIRVNPLCLGVDPGTGHHVALQVYIDDSDPSGDPKKTQLTWYSVGHSYLNSFAMYDVSLTENETTVLNGSSDLFITDGNKANLAVFGAKKGDKIQVDRNGGKFFEAVAANDLTWKPDTFSFRADQLDFDHDSLMVYINSEPAGFHDLYIAPRLYVKTKPKPFEPEIRNFVMKDRLSPPPRDGVLFIGSSSIRKWNTLKKDFPELSIIHRGFGGSTSEEALMYMDQIVLPYKPATIVYYEGDNDIPRRYSAEKIRGNVKRFIDRVLEQRPDTRIYILSPKPSINRMDFWPKYVEAQKALQDLAGEYPSVTYIDVSSPMFNPDGTLNTNIFVSDGIHMNADGYKIWTRVIRDSLRLGENPH